VVAEPVADSVPCAAISRRGGEVTRTQ
jgi:hypothetical protein